MRRAYWAVPAGILVTVVFAVVACLLGIVAARPAQALARPWARLLLVIAGLRVELSGVACPQPAVYAVNHVSLLDIPILFAHLPVDFRIIYKHSLSWVPLLGWYLRLAGHIEIDRSNPFRARRSLSRAAQRVGSGTSVAVFPEGTRRGSQGLGCFKRGSFLLAIEARVPVVPVSLTGVERLHPHGLLSLRSGLVLLDLHAPQPTVDVPASAAERLAEQVHDVVAAGLARRQVA